MLFDQERPSWSVEGRDWPNRQHSRFIKSGGMAWHVQEMGDGPSLLLLHGTGASTHSFRDLAPALAQHFRVLMLDLPGHGFTAMPISKELSLGGMARLIGGVLSSVDFDPQIVVGHSAGAAILIAMSQAGAIRPSAIVSVNGALRPIRGASLFSPLAKLLFLNPLAPKLFAWRALSSEATRRLLESTGSQVDERGIELYQRLFRKPGHIAGTLGMMANWDLERLDQAIASLTMPLVLVAASGDKAVPADDADIVAARSRLARVVKLEFGGHLVHEEEPQRIADLIVAAASEAGLQFDD